MILADSRQSSAGACVLAARQGDQQGADRSTDTMDDEGVASVIELDYGLPMHGHEEDGCIYCAIKTAGA